MAYTVELTSRAERDLADLYEFLSAENSRAARRWFNGLEKAIFSLQRTPRRCPPAKDQIKAGGTLRQLLHGKKPNVYRILFQIQEHRKLVRVVTIRHGARDELAKSEKLNDKA